MNYENLSYDDIHRLACENEDEYNKIPVEIIRKIIAEEAIKRNTVYIDDSSITFKEEYPYQNTPEKQSVEVVPVGKGKIIKIFLEKETRKYSEIPMAFATHVLEQVFDENDQLISEELKEIL